MDKPIRILSFTQQNVPDVLRYISRMWADLANAYGDKGSCVLGAGFEFMYQGKVYFMPPLCRVQGCIAWEVYKDQIQEQLEEIGATQITYEYGFLD